MLPPTKEVRPLSFNMAPNSAVVVVFPLVPVTASSGSRTKRGRQFDFADDRDPPGGGLRDRGNGVRNPGAEHDQLGGR